MSTTKTIGYDASGTPGDYTTIQSFLDSLPTTFSAGGGTGSYAVGPITGNLLRYGDASQGSFVLTTGLTTAGHTPDATNTLTLGCASGASFRDAAGAATNALYPSAANGACVTLSQAYAVGLRVSVPFVTIKGWQLAVTGNATVAVLADASTGVTLDSCLFRSAATSTDGVVNVQDGLVKNCVILNASASGNGLLLGFAGTAEDCTVVRPAANAAAGVGVSGSYSNCVAVGNAVFGFTTPFGGGGGFVSPSDYNATDQASSGLSVGTHNLTSQSYSASFVNTGSTITSSDFRIPTSSPLKDAGVAVSGISADVIGTTRPQGSVEDVGAWEFTSGGGVATAYTMTASPNPVSTGSTTTVTVTPTGGPYTGTVTVTPTGSGATGLSAHVFTFSNSSSPQTFGFTPTAAGTLTLTGTNSSTLTDPSAVGVTVTSGPIAYTSTGGGGNWNNSATWSPSGIPASGDTATIAASNPVTVPDGYTATVGTSPAAGGTTALTLNAALTVGGGTSGGLVVKGPVQQNEATVTFNAGSSLTFDASGAATPLSQTYSWQTAQDFSDTGTQWKCLGTSGARVTVSSNASGGNGYFRVPSGYNDSLWPDGTYTDFTRIGDATNDAFRIVASSGTRVVTFAHCTFTACGALYWPAGAPATGGWSITDSVWSGTVAASHSSAGTPTPLALNSNTRTTGTQLVSGCVFDEAPALVGQGGTIDGNVFMKAFDFIPTVGGSPWASFDSNLVRVDASHTTGVVCGGNVTNCFVLLDDRAASPSYTAAAGLTSGANPDALSATLTVSPSPAWTAHQWQSTGSHSWHVVVTGGTGVGQCRSVVDNTASVLTLEYNWDVLPDATTAFEIFDGVTNPHMLIPFYSDSTVGPVTFDGNVTQSTGVDNNGDCYLHMDGAFAYTLTRNIILPNAAGDNTGTLFTLGTSTSPTFKVENNTYFTGAQDVGISEGANNAPGQITSFRGNIAWCDPARTAAYSIATAGTNHSPYGPYKINDTTFGSSLPGSSVADVVSAANADYNCGYGQQTGYKGKGYNINMSGTPGVHDVDTDPQFLGRWRSFWGWAGTRGSAGTHPVTQTADGLAALRADPTLVSSSLVPYIRAGMAPAASGLHNANYSGATYADIGAVPFSSGVATAYTLTGPSSGTVGVASPNFTLTPNGTYSGTITPATGGSGVFTPTGLTWTSSSSAKTFTYTPSTTSGSPHSVSTTASPALGTDPSPVAFTVTSSGPLPLLNDNRRRRK